MTNLVDSSSNKQLVINVFASIISTLAGLGVAFLLTPFLISNIGKEVYSFYPIANNFVTYFTIIVNALNALASRFITIEVVKRNKEKAQEYFSSVFFANLFLAFVFIIPMVVIVGIVDKIFDIPEIYVRDVKILFILIFLSLLINVISSVFGVATFVCNRIDFRSYQQVVVILLRIILYIILFNVFPANIMYIGIVTLAESLMNCTIQIFLTKKLMPEFHICFAKAKLFAVKTLLSSGIWNSINSLGSNLLSGISVFMSNILMGAIASGNISIVQTLSNLCTTLISMMVNVFYPRMTREYAENGKIGLDKETKRSQIVMGGLITVPIVLLIIYGKPFYELWMPGEDGQLLQRLSAISLIPYVFQANMWTLTQIYSVLNRVKKPAEVMLGFGIVNIFLLSVMSNIFNNIIIIPIITSLLNVLYCVVFVPIHIARELSVSVIPYYLHIIKTLLSVVIICILGTIIRASFYPTTWLMFIVSGGISAILSYLIYFVVVILNRNTVFLIREKYIKRKVRF